MAKIDTFAKPTMLFRYRSFRSIKKDGAYRASTKLIKREISAINDQYIFCPKYTEMNDPMEGLYASTRRVREEQNYQDFLETVRQEKLELGIAAFCETWNNPLMWAHYADGFRGICIAYSFSKLLRHLDEQYSFARVGYGDRRFSVNAAKSRDEAERARAILSTKNQVWNYEREWRLFAPNRSKARYGHQVVKRIYLGTRMDQADRDLIRDQLQDMAIEVRETRVKKYSVVGWPPTRKAPT